MTAALPFRLARATVFAVVCLGLSVAAHRLGGGPVSTPVAAGGLLLAFGAGVAASGGERPLTVIFPLLAGVQAVLHVLFTLGHTPAAHHVTGHTHMSGLAPSAGMLVAHAWAAGLTALWLARGEAALWGLLRRLAVRLHPVLVACLQPVHKPIAAVAAPEPGRLRSALLAFAAPRRGPPHAQVSCYSG
ncbi:MFS transporter [Sphaerisporangium dianthi]|uniref:MFS transporter n=1 Tax=Sphaerisporangium dianthi TaxID=1436120 RepID=A0ABV9CD41_9ACTN